jgi:branched-chain amino acid transport system substrate-binding protein
LVLFAYYTDGALLLQQAADVGLNAKIVTSGACYNQKFIELGGDAVEGVVMPVEFFAGDPRPDIRRFVDTYRQRYREPPDLFAAYAYDAVKIVGWAAQRAQPRERAVPVRLRSAGRQRPRRFNYGAQTNIRTRVTQLPRC